MAMNFSTNKDAPLTDDIVAGIQSDDRRIYVIGKIVYCDFFGEEHQTRFCGIVDVGTGEMSMHHQYNYMD